MYLTKYNRVNKKYHKKNNRIKNNKGIYGGIIRFLKLAIIIVSIVPTLYFIDRGYNFLNRSVNLDSFFTVRNVKIKGNTFISMDELSHYLKGVQGKSILSVNLKGVANKIKNHPWVRDVSVRRELPGTIWVDVLERTPAVYVNTDSKLYIADEEGVILGNNSGELLRLPVVYGIDISGIKSGVKSREEGLKSAIEVKRVLTSIPWIDLTTTGIEVGERSQIVLHLKGYRIKLGRGGYQEKLQRFYNIVKNLQDRDIPYKEVDLRFENQVIVKTLDT